MEEFMGGPLFWTPLKLEQLASRTAVRLIFYFSPVWFKVFSQDEGKKYIYIM